MKTFDARHDNKPCVRCGRKGRGRSKPNESSSSSRVRRRGGVSGGSRSRDAVAALPAQWLCAPGGWAGPPRRPAPGAENTGGLCLLRVGARWLPSGVCRNPGAGRKDRGRQRVRATQRMAAPVAVQRATQRDSLPSVSWVFLLEGSTLKSSPGRQQGGILRRYPSHLIWLLTVAHTGAPPTWQSSPPHP